MTTTRLPKTITAGALLATPIPPVKWIIPGLLPAGLAIFAGPSKAGKSWLTLWLCLQISQGKSVWGREIEPRTVLYFSLEDTLGRLQERLYKLVDAEEDPERLISVSYTHLDVYKRQVSGLPVMFPCLGASGKLDIFLQHLF